MRAARKFLSVFNMLAAREYFINFITYNKTTVADAEAAASQDVSDIRKSLKRAAKQDADTPR